MIEMLKQIQELDTEMKNFLIFAFFVAALVISTTIASLSNIIALYIKRKYPKDGDNKQDKEN